MNETAIRIRANRVNGELEIEGSSQEVREWWDRLWPELNQAAPASGDSFAPVARGQGVQASGNGQLPELFGEYYGGFRSNLSDTEKMLVAATFAQGKDPDKTFTTKSASQLLLDQNVKIGNPSEAVRRLVHAKRVFVAVGGRFRVSASGYDFLKSLMQMVED